jgi:hypothetical protein
MDRRFTIAVLIVSGLAALAVALLVNGSRRGELALEASGMLLAVMSWLAS